MSLDLPANALGMSISARPTPPSAGCAPGADPAALEEGKITLPSVLFFNYEERHSVFGRLALHEYLEATSRRCAR